jgi:hypothetical protein
MGEKPNGEETFKKEPNWNRHEDNIKINIESEYRAWPGFILLKTGTVAGSREHGNELSGST